MGRTERSEPAAVEFGARVRAFREELGLSQEKLGLRCNPRKPLSTPYISSVERGERNVSLFNILRLAAALEIDAAQLVRELPAPPLRGRY
jgi:transcriptional regulator with XRE-family HTH domain